MAAERFRLGDWIVDPAVDEILRDGQVVKLEPRRMLLLVTLADRAGEVVTPDELMDAVWPGVVVTQSSIYQSVAQLRKTLGDNRSTPEYIATVPRKGYRLIATVGTVAPVDDEAVVALPAIVPVPDRRVATIARAPMSASPTVGHPTAPGIVDARRRRLIGGVVGMGALATGAGAGAWWWLRPVPLIEGTVRIAVLPFADQSAGNIEQAAADGLANDVIRRFERSDNVLVLARNSSFTFRKVTDERGTLRLLKEQLNADYALIGELFKTSERVRVAARLLAVASGKMIWTMVFTQPLDRLANLPGLIAGGALKALGVQEPPPTEMNPLNAYELYLLGLNAFQTQRTIEGLRKARDYFQHAIDTDPSYARAYAGIAGTWLNEFAYGYGIDGREASAKAQPLIDKALALDANLLEGLIAQGKLLSVTSWADGDRARSYMQKAVDLYPGSAEAQFALGISYAFDAQPREAIRRYTMALQLDPLSYVIHSRWGQDATFLGDFEAARVHFAKAAALSPRYPWRFLGPGQADYAQGRLDDAVGNYRLQFEQDPRRPDLWSELAWLYLDLGHVPQARIAFDRKAALDAAATRANLDRAYMMLAEGGATALSAAQAELSLATPLSDKAEIDRLMILSVTGKPPTVQQLDVVRDAMRADPVPWVGSYWIFLGGFAWIDLAALYDVAGVPASATPLLEQGEKMLATLTSRGNVFHTIPYFEARIAALRGQRDLAIAKLGHAVDLGWRRTWMLSFDPAFRQIRDDPRIATLAIRVRKDMDLQRGHVG